MDIIDNTAASRYEIHVGDEVALLDYKRHGDRVVLVHTEVPTSLEGHGLAGQLTKRALDDARAAGLKVVPRCPYAVTYLERHPEYADLVWKHTNGAEP
jgi:predicted GNAT family acetyltransferase